MERIAGLAVEIADVLAGPPNFFFGKTLDADDLSKEQDYRKKVRRAAELCKADLTTGMVGEFPELQGVMGRYYARAQGEDASVADAIRDHYKPQGPNDVVPTDPVSVAVALADKLDTLVGFWAINEKPTGSKDPYALRRAALGFVRLALANELRLKLLNIFEMAAIDVANALFETTVKDLRHYEDVLEQALGDARQLPFAMRMQQSARAEADLFAHREKIEEFFREKEATENSRNSSLAFSLLSFFADRLKVHLRDTGARHDLIDAVFTLPGQDDLLMIVRRVEALGKFLDSEDGKNLLVGYRRAANILRAEEKKDGEGAFDDPPDHHLIEAKGQAEEKALFHVMQAAEGHARKHVEAEDFESAMRALAELRPAVDAFFDHVTVNADDPALRANRLKLLNMLRRATLAVADFSKIGG